MRAGLSIFLGTGVVLMLSVLSLFVGVAEMSPRDLFHDPEAARLPFISRLPRTAAALIAGAALSVSGAVLQMLVRVRYVEPMTVGTGQGAFIGILIAINLFPKASILIKMALATVTAMMSAGVFLVIVQRLPQTQPLLVPLVGLIFGGIVGACGIFVAYQADLLQYIGAWISGELSGILQGRYELLWLAAAVTVFTYLVADQLSIAGLGRDASINLGLNYRQVMVLGVLSISVVAAVTVVTIGMIPFVGLIVPNIVSRRHGDNLRRTLPMIAFIGAALVLGADILGRLVRYPYEIPVSTVTGVVGAGVFLVLLYRGPRHAH